ERRGALCVFAGGRRGQPVSRDLIRQDRVPLVYARLAIQSRQHPLLLIGAANDFAGELRSLLLRHLVRRKSQADATNQHAHAPHHSIARARESSPTTKCDLPLSRAPQVTKAGNESSSGPVACTKRGQDAQWAIAVAA